MDGLINRRMKRNDTRSWIALVDMLLFAKGPSVPFRSTPFAQRQLKITISLHLEPKATICISNYNSNSLENQNLKECKKFLDLERVLNPLLRYRRNFILSSKSSRRPCPRQEAPPCYFTTHVKNSNGDNSISLVS